MKTLLLTLALVFSQQPHRRNRPRRNLEPALTIYNQNFFVAREHLPLDLKAGRQPRRLRRRRRARRARLGHPARSRRTRPADSRAELPQRSRLAGTAALVLRRQDHRISWCNADDKIIKGKIIRSGYVPSYSYASGYPQQPAYSQPIIEVDGVLRFGLPGQPLFPALERRFHPQADAELAARRPTSPASSTPKSPTSAAA